MAYPVQITIGTGNKVSVNYQSQEVNVCVTYQLERGENDLLTVAREKAGEVIAAHGIMWARVRGETTDEKNARMSSTPTEEAEVPTAAEGDDAPPGVHQLLLSGGQLAAIEALLVQAGWSQTQVEDHLLEEFGKSELSELSGSQATQLLLELQREERGRIQSNSQNRRSAPSTRNGRQ